MRREFELLVHKSDAQAYENLFSHVMRYVDNTFKPVKPHGNIGDRGNDGWSSVNGTYYQVYAPESLAQNNDKAIKKLKDDFAKLKGYWDEISPVRKFYFVVNDKFKGVSPHIYRAVSELAIEHKLESAEVFLCQRLEFLLFHELSGDEIRNVLNIISSQDSDEIFYKSLIRDITRSMCLRHWYNISENLISNVMESKVLDGICDAILHVFKLELPETLPSLNESILELMSRAEALTHHFTHSKYTCESNGFWRRDMSWRKERFDDQNEYLRIYDEYENWRLELFRLHQNYVHALNLFSAEVRRHIDPNFFNRSKFSVIDSLGTYNNLEGYEFIPDEYK